MSTTVYAIRSADGNLELALCPATIELRLSPQAAKEFDAAWEAEKSAGWLTHRLPLWRQIRSSLVSAAQFMSHQAVDKLRSIPLEAVTSVACASGRLEVWTADGSQISGEWKIGVGSHQIECQLDAPGFFAEAEAGRFAQCFEAVKPLYEAYLAELRQTMP